MTTTVSGVIFGDTIKLDCPIDLVAGQKVEVVILPLEASTKWGEGLKRCAGMLAGETHLDSEMEEIHRDHRRPSFRDLGE